MNSRSRPLPLAALVCLLLAVSTSCRTADKNKQGQGGLQSATYSDTLAYEMKRIEKIYNDGKHPGEGDAYYRCSFPVFAGGGPADRINRQIHAWIADSSSGDKGVSIEEKADTFLKAYGNARKQSGMSLPYYHDLTGSVVLNRRSLLTVALSIDSFSGGAHGFAYTQYFVFDTNSGKRLALTDLFMKGFEATLNARIESRYRKEMGLSKSDSLSDRLFENHIRFNNNFALAPEGLVFCYNDYEIAPYSSGPTVIALSYRELADILKPEFRALQAISCSRFVPDRFFAFVNI